MNAYQRRKKQLKQRILRARNRVANITRRMLVSGEDIADIQFEISTLIDKIKADIVLLDALKQEAA